MKSIDLAKLKVYPLTERDSMAGIEETLIDPMSAPSALSDANQEQVSQCAVNIRAARERGASVMYIYGAHLIKNGAHKLLDALMAGGWITHLATNGAGVIHDWEWAHHGRSTESVRANVATGTFGTWEETGRCLHLAVLAGALHEEGFGTSVGRMVTEDGIILPARAELEAALRDEPSHPLSPARAELLQAMNQHNLAEGQHKIAHPWKASCVLGNAFRHHVPLTVHPGIGYDIISNHPLFNGAALGRAAGLDFATFGGSVEGLDGGVVLSVGSAIMGPQVFEKSISCVNNLRLQADLEIVSGHSIHVVDIQDGGGWDWTQGEPPKDNPAYYLRFCKSYDRMGGTMHYAQCDNIGFTHHLLNALNQ
ncbi:MAG: hypothetical protein CMO66_04090 [Verrucomicrobiales bacterium]|nr:hypothetical protein [Verrucomicrobiales bacterium]MBR90437.1 hypothetical protein [Verrucomicrobiales bacterium]|tara:strand:+ start:4810 stop:5907 length:1098 start_codon:yes stop_codon:yes gene_type:complete